MARPTHSGETSPGHAAAATTPVAREMDEHQVERLREAVYGVIVLLSVLVVLSERQPSAAQAALSVAGTSLVLFFAHVYAGALAERIRRGALPDLESLRRIASASWPVVAVITWPLVVLALAGLGALSTSTAIAISVWLAVAALGLAGWRAAQIGHASLVGKLLSTAVNLAVGMCIVVLKVVFH